MMEQLAIAKLQQIYRNALKKDELDERIEKAKTIKELKEIVRELLYMT